MNNAGLACVAHPEINLCLRIEAPIGGDTNPDYSWYWRHLTWSLIPQQIFFLLQVSASLAT